MSYAGDYADLRRASRLFRDGYLVNLTVRNPEGTMDALSFVLGLLLGVGGRLGVVEGDLETLILMPTAFLELDSHPAESSTENDDGDYPSY